MQRNILNCVLLYYNDFCYNIRKQKHPVQWTCDLGFYSLFEINQITIEFSHKSVSKITQRICQLATSKKMLTGNRLIPTILQYARWLHCKYLQAYYRHPIGRFAYNRQKFIKFEGKIPTICKYSWSFVLTGKFFSLSR